MRPSEWLAFGYFGVFAVAGLFQLRRNRSAWRTIALSLLGGAAAAVAPSVPAMALGGLAVPMRDWWLLVALPLAYWAPAPLVRSADQRLEARLLAADAAMGLGPAAGPSPLLELSYLLVYPMVPAGLAAVLNAGTITADTFWLATLVSVLPCYGLLPLLPTRPPRALPEPAVEVATGMPLTRRANVRFLEVFGNRWNTLPSGHAAGAAAVALLVWRSGSPLGPAFLLLAAGIALGTVRGRYHYAVDTLLGVALGLAAGLLTG